MDAFAEGSTKVDGDVTVKDYLKTYVIQLALGGFVIADSMFGYQGLGNLALFGFWTLIVLSLICLSMDEEQFNEFFNKNPENKFARILGLTNLTILIYFGWIVTAIGSFSTWLLLYAKRQESKKQNQVIQK